MKYENWKTLALLIEIVAEDSLSNNPKAILKEFDYKTYSIIANLDRDGILKFLSEYVVKLNLDKNDFSLICNDKILRFVMAGGLEESLINNFFTDKDDFALSFVDLQNAKISTLTLLFINANLLGNSEKVLNRKLLKSGHLTIIDQFLTKNKKNLLNFKVGLMETSATIEILCNEVVDYYQDVKD